MMTQSNYVWSFLCDDDDVITRNEFALSSSFFRWDALNYWDDRCEYLLLNVDFSSQLLIYIQKLHA